ncbi:hypothetical protein [Pseudonocardia thermophila]|uniref:hypothetical protein n=1 Tax=Pseudonocardia thermophila TaxID=1848 RepID=UPI00248EF812|nr:hypothetical protein [Pseudonocardia thermophila]
MRWVAVLALVAGLSLIGDPAFAQPPGGGAVPPEPDRPGSGLVGLLDPTTGAGDPATVYGEIGYAGTTWHAYDVCHRPDATTATTDTWVGNTLFNAAKVLVAAANGLHDQLGAADRLDGLDALLRTGAGAVHRVVFTTWAGVAVLLLAVGLLWPAARGDLARQAQRVLTAVAALAIGGLVYAAPVSLLKASDAVLFDGITQLQQGLLGELGAGAPDALPETLTREIVYANWLRGQFGSADAPQARELGRDLLRAQAFTRAEIAAGADTADAAAQKKQRFTELVERMGDRLPQFQGVAGSRVGAGGSALLQALALAAFPAAAKLVVVVAMIVLRLLVLFAPLVVVVAILRPEVLIGLFRLFGGVLVNALLAAVLAAAHAWLVVTLLRPDSGVAPALGTVITAIVSALFWTIVRPGRRLAAIGALLLPRPLPVTRAAPVPDGPGPPVRSSARSAPRPVPRIPDPPRRLPGDQLEPPQPGAALPAPRGGHGNGRARGGRDGLLVGRRPLP